MRRCLVFFVPVALVVLSLAGCGGSEVSSLDEDLVETQAASPSSVYWPLKVSNQWAYRFFTYPTAPAPNTMLQMGLQPQAAPSSCVTQVLRISGAGVDGSGLRWYDARTSQVGMTAQYTKYRHTAGGMMCKAPQVAEPYYLIKAPLQRDHEWNMTGNIMRRFIGTAARTVVPAGTFTQCLLIHQTYTTPALSGMVVKYWYARNVGLVRWEIWDGGVLTNKCELKSSSLLPAI